MALCKAEYLIKSERKECMMRIIYDSKTPVLHIKPLNTDKITERCIAECLCPFIKYGSSSKPYIVLFMNQSSINIKLINNDYFLECFETIKEILEDYHKKSEEVKIKCDDPNNKNQVFNLDTKSIDYIMLENLNSIDYEVRDYNSKLDPLTYHQTDLYFTVPEDVVLRSHIQQVIKLKQESQHQGGVKITCLTQSPNSLIKVSEINNSLHVTQVLNTNTPNPFLYGDIIRCINDRPINRTIEYNEIIKNNRNITISRLPNGKVFIPIEKQKNEVEFINNSFRITIKNIRYFLTSVNGIDALNLQNKEIIKNLLKADIHLYFIVHQEIISKKK